MPKPKRQLAQLYGPEAELLIERYELWQAGQVDRYSLWIGVSAGGSIDNGIDQESANALPSPAWTDYHIGQDCVNVFGMGASGMGASGLISTIGQPRAGNQAVALLQNPVVLPISKQVKIQPAGEGYRTAP